MTTRRNHEWPTPDPVMVPYEMDKYDFDTIARALAMYARSADDINERGRAGTLKERFYRAHTAFIITEEDEWKAGGFDD